MRGAIERNRRLKFDEEHDAKRVRLTQRVRSTNATREKQRDAHREHARCICCWPAARDRSKTSHSFGRWIALGRETCTSQLPKSLFEQEALAASTAQQQRRGAPARPFHRAAHFAEGGAGACDAAALGLVYSSAPQSGQPLLRLARKQQWMTAPWPWLQCRLLC